MLPRAKNEGMRLRWRERSATIRFTDQWKRICSYLELSQTDGADA